MNSSLRLILSASLVACGVGFPLRHARSSAPATRVGAGTDYVVTGQNARWNHRPLGPATTLVNGVPAQPVDSMVWDGVGSQSLERASIALRVDPVAETGFLRANWTDSYGDWNLEIDTWVHPHHSSGAQIGPTVDDTINLINDPITTNVYLHGDTGAGPGVLPTVFTLVAAWGRAEVTLNGQPFENPFDGPAALGRWDAHIMVTAGVRGEDGTVRNTNGGIYDPSYASEGLSTGDDLEFHITFHDERFPLTANVPPLFEFFYHLVFEDVEVRISHADDPGE
ncbi:MAG: hypothetical protein GY711_30465 [bacterium]|nr:hypothetical protein [bacterium]